MMTIKEFASLCGCNTQTLRYYDRIDLLKPVQVDRWSGYRYYEKRQALDYVRIKNLQAADFSIEEIKGLLSVPDDMVLEAFDAKLAEQQRKLVKIREIQQSYLKEKNMMEQLIHSLTDFILRQIGDPDGLEEFGLCPEDGEQILAHIRSYLEAWLRPSAGSSEQVSLLVDDEMYRGAQSVAEKIESLKDDDISRNILLGDETLSEQDTFRPEQYASVWETHGFAHVRDFIDRIPPLEDGQEYYFLFEMNEQSYPEDVAFPMFMLGAMILKKGAARVRMGCDVQKSADEQNHFKLMRRE